MIWPFHIVLPVTPHDVKIAQQGKQVAPWSGTIFDAIRPDNKWRLRIECDKGKLVKVTWEVAY